MTSGRKPVPVELRALHGNPRKTKMPEDVPEGVGALWAPPEWMDDDQRAQWFYALDHAPAGLLSGTDREILAIWCVAAVEHARAVRQVRALGQVVKTKEGNAIQSPFVGVMNRQALIMLRAGSELGFSPAARTALGRDPHEGAAGGDARWIGRGKVRGSLQAYLEEKPDRLDA